MHISLDSALGRQRRLNSVGESVLQIAPDAAAAYSLRSLTGGDPDVVRVRRESDNTEKDFSGSQIESGEMARWVNEQPTLPLDLRELDANTGERDGALIEAAAAYSLRNLSAEGTDVQPSGDSPRPVADNTDLFLPDDFPVTLQKNDEGYFIKETGADWFANYVGATLYVSPSGNDATGDGSSSNPYQSLNTVISNASDNDVINMSAGIYAMPTLAVSKDLAFVCPSGKAYIGTFNDLSSAQIDAIDYSGTTLHNVDDVVTGETFKGWIRTDGTLVGGVRGSAVSETNGQAIDYQNFGVMSVYAGSTSANFSTGTSETLQELVNAGSVLAWSDADTDRFRVATGTSVYIGENITLASYGTDVVAGIGSANLILDGCEIYGGSNNCVSHPGSGSVIMFNTLVAGSNQDNIDYRGTAIAVESNITSNWCNTGASDNTSTGHDSCKVLRVGGTYRGGSRTVHDVNDTKAYVYSCTIGDAVANDKTLLLSGFSTLGSETCTLGYGDITFIDTFNDGGLTNLYIDSEATATNSELNQGWSYFPAGKYVVQVRRSSDDAVKSFTASEVADGTLESWVNADVTLYTQSGNLNIPAGSGTFVTLPSYTVENTIGHTFRISFKLKRNTGGSGTSGAISVRTTSTWNYTTLEKSSNLTEKPNRFEINTSTEEYQTYSFTCSTNEGSNEGFLRFQTYDSNDSYTVKDFNVEVIKSNGHVRTWYDQSGSDNHAVQTTPANQPKIVEGGNILKDSNNNPEVVFTRDDSQFLTASSPIAFNDVFFKFRRTDATNATNGILSEASSGAFPYTYIHHSSQTFSFDGNASDTVNLSFNGQYEESQSTDKAGLVTIDDHLVYLNYTSNPDAISDIGRLYNGSLVYGSFGAGEFILYNSDQSTKRRAIEENIANHYDISLAAFSRDGTVSTWYDQSGRTPANHATQTDPTK